LVRQAIVGGVAFVVGTVGGVVWSRWRQSVVAELRAIRHMLETEQVPLLRAIRDRLAPPDELDDGGDGG
jgi:hypothetical protein